MVAGWAKVMSDAGNGSSPAGRDRPTAEIQEITDVHGNHAYHKNHRGGIYVSGIRI